MGHDVVQWKHIFQASRETLKHPDGYFIITAEPFFPFPTGTVLQ